MGSGNDSGMIFHLDASNEYDAALMQIALDDTGCKYRITSAEETGMLLGKIEDSLVFDQHDEIEYKVIRFIIEPGKNPIQQGFEIAGIIKVLEENLRVTSSDPEELEFHIQKQLISKVDPLVSKRFEDLQKKFSEMFK